ncbi:hypothetical protein R1sor_026660 [Riccia sorocarpa]|uniref:Uncharacterized protein n=1 Tax=Riccia sorocarpa TaxID=122646 RepID=A0ABD3GC02_9MARC
MLDEAKLLEPNKDVDGLVIDTTRAKKIKEAAHDEEEEDTTTPKKKSSETKNPGSGKWLYSYLQFLLPADLAGTLSRFVSAVYKFHSWYPGRGSKARAKASTGGEKPPRKSRKKGGEEVEEEAVPAVGSSQQAPTQEVEPADVVVEPVIVEVEVEAAEEADEERQRKRPKKRETEVSKLYEGYFRSDIYIPIPQTLVVARSSLKHTVYVLQANKSSAQKAKVVLVEELKGLCSRIDAFRTQGYYINKKETNVAVDCLFLDMPSGFKISPARGEVPVWNEYPEDEDLPRKLMNLGRVILDDRGCIIILHPGTLRSTQQIADALDANISNWMHLASYDVNSDLPQFEPVRNMKVFHSKADIFCKTGHTINIPKLDLPPFDPENSATLTTTFISSRCCIALETRKEGLESMNLTLQRIEKKIQSLKPGDKTTRAKSSDPAPSSDKARGKRPLGDEDDLGDDILGDDKTSGFEDNVQLLNVWGRQTSAPRYEDIVKGLHSQPMSYTLPVYAADAARRMAEMPRTPRDSRLDNRFVSNKRRNPFVDDIALEDHEMAVNLSSDEDL